MKTYRTKQRHFYEENNFAELAEIMLCNKDVLGRNENLRTYRQNISTIHKTEPEVYS